MLIGLRVCLLGLFLSTAGAAWAGPFDSYAGRWAGWGQLQLTNGGSEKMKCVTTYFIKRGGNSATQNFRCASPGYRLDAVVNYTATSSGLTGDWRERIYSNGGSLRGTVSSSGMNYSFRSETFAGQVKISKSNCSQSIRIRPRGGVDISQLSVSLKRC